MSRWIKNFESHPFHTSLKNLEDIISKIDEATITDINILDEVARIKELLIYIKKFIVLINPKISTSNLQQNLNSINQSFNNTNSEINAYNLNKNIGHLNNANNNLDNVLNQLKLFNISLPTFNHQSIYSMLSTYEKTLDKSLSQIDLPIVVSSSNQIKNLKKMLIDGSDEKLSIEEEIENTVNNIEIKNKELLDYYNTVLNDKEFDNTLKELISSAKDTVLEETKDVHDKYVEFSNKIDDLNKFYSKIFGEINSDDIRVNGLDQEVNKILKELNTFKEERQKVIENNVVSLNTFIIEQKALFEKELSEKFEKITKYEKEQHENNKNLYEQIESFLPHATTTGLAKAFEVERKKFSVPIFRWNMLFVSSLFLMFLATFFTFLNITITESEFTMSFSQVKGIEDTINNIFYKLPLYGPLIWLCIYASKRRSENQRLEQEYAHKEALAKSYSSYKKQIDDLSPKNEELLAKLLNSAIDTISNNASETLDKKHGDGTPLQAVVNNK